MHAKKGASTQDLTKTCKPACLQSPTTSDVDGGLPSTPKAARLSRRDKPNVRAPQQASMCSCAMLVLLPPGPIGFFNGSVAPAFRPRPCRTFLFCPQSRVLSAPPLLQSCLTNPLDALCASAFAVNSSSKLPFEPMLAKTNVGQSIFGQSIFGQSIWIWVCVCVSWECPKGGAQTQKKSGRRMGP